MSCQGTYNVFGFDSSPHEPDESINAAGFDYWSSELCPCCAACLVRISCKSEICGCSLKSLPCGLIAGKSLMSEVIVVERSSGPHNGRSFHLPSQQPMDTCFLSHSVCEKCAYRSATNISCANNAFPLPSVHRAPAALRPWGQRSSTAKGKRNVPANKTSGSLQAACSFSGHLQAPLKVCSWQCVPAVCVGRETHGTYGKQTPSSA